MALLLISSFSQITEASFALHLLRASFLKNIHFLLCKILNSNFVKIRAIFSVVQGRCGGDIIYEELGSQLQNKHIVLWGQICCWCYFYSMGWSGSSSGDMNEEQFHERLNKTDNTYKIILLVLVLFSFNIHTFPLY